MSGAIRSRRGPLGNPVQRSCAIPSLGDALEVKANIKFRVSEANARQDCDVAADVFHGVPEDGYLGSEPVRCEGERGLPP